MTVAVDSSVAIAALATWHDAHRRVRQAIGDAAVIPAHARLETYSVLTRLPVPHRMSLDVAAGLISIRFPSDRVLLPPRALAGSIVERCHAAGVEGGAVYDALVALTAAETGHALLTRDRRAAETYERLDVTFDLLD